MVDWPIRHFSIFMQDIMSFPILEIVCIMDDTYFALHTVHNGYELEKVFGIRPHILSECFDEKVWNFILEERKRGKSVPQIFLENKIDIQMLTEVGTYETFNPFCGTVLGIPSNGYYPEILDVYGGQFVLSWLLDQ